MADVVSRPGLSSRTTLLCGTLHCGHGKPLGPQCVATFTTGRRAAGGSNASRAIYALTNPCESAAPIPRCRRRLQNRSAPAPPPLPPLPSLPEPPSRRQTARLPPRGLASPQRGRGRARGGGCQSAAAGASNPPPASGLLNHQQC
eukprot:scaffold2088_cov399-Prasinococcus_capsulatus_cf.AAC.28